MFDWLFRRNQERPERKQQTEPQQYPEVSPKIDRDAVEETLPADPEHPETQVDGLHQQITHLMHQTEALQRQLERLDQRSSFGNEQLETLLQHLPDVANWAGPLDQRLAELTTWAEQNRDELTELEKNIRKLSRTQFKSNSLAESQQERLQSALGTLQDLAARKQEAAERAWQEQREASETARREARVAMTIDLFPALDGLESALESGRAFLERSRPPSVPQPDFLTRLGYAFGLRDLPPAPTRDTQAVSAWLDGLDLVRERFLTLLKSEGIQHIRAEGKPFDPHLHVAIEAVERFEVPAGTVVEEQRAGYRLGDQVLRYAEVVVNRDSVAEEPEEAEMEPAVRAWGPQEKWEVGADGPQKLEEPEGAEEPQRPEELEEPWKLEVGSEIPQEPEEEPKETWKPEEKSPEPQEPVEGEPEVKREQKRAAGVEPERLYTDEGEVAEDVKEKPPTADSEDDQEPVDPEVEEMIARFEERRRSRQEG
ncbi:MAG: Protein GrpE [Anaerolineales bacterium]|nr:Protein GrpE [Anaerolineales bacterium]